MMLLLSHSHPILMLLIQDIPHQTNLLPHMELDKYILLGKYTHHLKANQFLGKDTHLLKGNQFLGKDIHLHNLVEYTLLLKDNLCLDKLQQMEEVCETFCFNEVLSLSI